VEISTIWGLRRKRKGTMEIWGQNSNWCRYIFREGARTFTYLFMGMENEEAEYLLVLHTFFK
jgi:hypothetical protein